MTDETAADDGRDDAADAVDESATGGDATGEDSAGAEWHPNEPVPPELQSGADDGIDDELRETVADDGIDDELRETVADDLADLEDDEPDYPSGDDPVERQRVDAENAAFVVLGVAAILAIFGVLLFSI